jgi:PKHD-type hydroxylase
MNLKWNYWYFKNAIPHRICDQIVKHGQSLQEQLALVGHFKNDKLSKKEIKDLKKIRNSNISWIKDSWVYRTILPYINIANKNAKWNFQIDYPEPCQFTKYKLNQYYDWHQDSFEDPYDKNNENPGKIRKLSVTCSLSDSKEYKGGELEFSFYKGHRKNINITCNEILPKGSVVVFPSHVWHRVRPVIKGTRYSLVIWMLGDPFK